MIDSDVKFYAKCFLAGVVMAAVGSALWGCAYTVDEGEKAVITTFGEVSRVDDPGVHFKIPFVQTKNVYSTRIHKVSFNNLSAYSYDQQIIENYKVSITWSYNPDRLEEIYRKFGTKDSIFTTVVSPVVQMSTKSVLGRYTAQTIIQDRSKLEEAISNDLKKHLDQYPITIASIQLEDVNFSKSYEKVIEETARKKMEIEKSRNELQKVDLEAQQLVKQAESQNKAVKLKAEADAYQISTMAKAEAEAIAIKAKAEAEAMRLKGDALTKNPELVKLEIARKWNGSVPVTLIGSGGADGKGNPLNIVPVMNIGK